MGNPNKKPAYSLPNIFEVFAGSISTTVYSHLKEDIIRANTINYLLDKLGTDNFENYRKLDVKIVRPQIDIDQYCTDVLKDTNFFTRFLIPKSFIYSLVVSSLLLDKWYTNVLMDYGYREARSMHDELEKFFND